MTVAGWVRMWHDLFIRRVRPSPPPPRPRVQAPPRLTVRRWRGSRLPRPRLSSSPPCPRHPLQPWRHRPPRKLHLHSIFRPCRQVLWRQRLELSELAPEVRTLFPEEAELCTEQYRWDTRAQIPRNDGEHGYITTGGNHGYGGADSIVTELRVFMRWKPW